MKEIKKDYFKIFRKRNFHYNNYFDFKKYIYIKIKTKIK